MPTGESRAQSVLLPAEPETGCGGGMVSEEPFRGGMEGLGWGGCCRVVRVGT